MSAKLTLTMTLLKPRVIALGTIGISLHEVATRGATKARGPPFTVTFGLPTAVDPCEPQYGMGGINSLTHVCHCVNEEKEPLIDSHVDALLVVSMPVTSLRNFSAPCDFGISASVRPNDIVVGIV